MLELKIENIKEEIDAILHFLTYNGPIGELLMGLIYIAIVFYFGKIAITNLLKGGEGFNFDVLKQGVFYILIAIGFREINDFIIFVGDVFANYVNLGQSDLSDTASAFHTQFKETMTAIDQSYKDEMNTLREDNSIIDDAVFYVKHLDQKIIVGVADFLFDVMIFFDYMMMILFYVISRIWQDIIFFGGPIALVVSIYSGGTTVLLNWFKNYIGVVLWLPVGGLVLKLINAIVLFIVKSSTAPMIVEINNYADIGIASTSVKLGGLLTMLAGLIVLFIVSIVMKLILLGKVPQMINTWVSGSAGGGGGLAAAFLGASLVKSVAGKVSGIAGGIGAQGLKKLKKNG